MRGNLEPHGEHMGPGLPLVQSDGVKGQHRAVSSGVRAVGGGQVAVKVTRGRSHYDRTGVLLAGTLPLH